MTPLKRFFDVFVALLLLILLGPLLIFVAVWILAKDGRPVFYLAKRMRTSQDDFQLIKFRTMTVALDDSGVSGGDKSSRITKAGEFLRKTRLDEIPQLWNVLCGDISFVGPRPPLRQYVEQFPEIYSKVLISRPGITGLASVYFHEHEEKLLARSRSSSETDAIYTRACIPRKAMLDLIYQQRRNLCMDIAIMIKTVFKSLR
ncbi:sugar transferase [Variovorax sp.]|jgi:lipopolysaccharide/colanic/teichoic acid biosynthesis glycosyltransferase|uniref:sugar transferase n=1 Tax=Variovorax sp. TaxID=1871043 RepID=UPI0037D9BED3